ncbi:Polygalacturonase [Camellia lanceoleosa]|uniref:Polygalacturonase n=1 Tax=Camellia lanceoleosa TaxID=1840588 RepID=A0ACC0G884_9ERIC|nr:Polygalacturonase [Camellia lanceoleosa]
MKRARKPSPPVILFFFVIFLFTFSIISVESRKNQERKSRAQKQRKQRNDNGPDRANFPGPAIFDVFSFGAKGDGIDGTLLALPKVGSWPKSSWFQWINFKWVQNLTIQGTGIVDGQGSNWWSSSQTDHIQKRSKHIPDVKPTALRFYDSYNVTVRDIRIINSPQCHLKFDNSGGVKIDNITISAPQNSPNTDGIHLQNTQDVEIQHSNIGCGDDCVSIQTGCSNVHVHHINCGPGHGISLGGLGKDKSVACVSDIVVENIFMQNTLSGVRIKTWQGGIGSVKNVTFSNIQVEDVKVPIMIDQYYCDNNFCKNQTGAVAICGIKFDQIIGTYSVQPIHLACSNEIPCTDVDLINIQLKASSSQGYGGFQQALCFNSYGKSQAPLVPSSMDYCLRRGGGSVKRIAKFITTVQQRGAAIIQARKLSSALSAASFACDHIRDWVLGTPKGTWVSMGVYSDGSYGIQPGLIYSFPITCEKGDWSIVQGLKIDEFSRAKMDATAKELMEEKSLAYSCLKREREFKVAIKFAAKADIHHLQEFLRELTHREDGKRYKISGVSAQPTSQLTFARDDMDAKISVIQYFRERYHINLKFAYLPALQAGSDLKPVYLPMELCKIVEGQRYSKKLNEKQVTALLRATCQRPFERVQSISRMVEHNNYNNDKFVNEFGLRVKTELTSIDARVLPAPMLKYQGTQEVPRVGCWNMIDKKMVNGGKVEFWTCVSFSRLRRNEKSRLQKYRLGKQSCKELPDSSKDGNELPSELLQTLLKMAPTSEEELKLRLFSGKDEGLRLFIIVRDFLIMLDKACKDIKDLPKKPNRTPRREGSIVPPSPDPHQSPDLHQRLFPAIKDQRMDYSSSDDDL